MIRGALIRTTLLIYLLNRSPERSAKRRPWCIKCARHGHPAKDCIAKFSIYGDDLEKRREVCKLCGFYGHAMSECDEDKTFNGVIISSHSHPRNRNETRPGTISRVGSTVKGAARRDNGGRGQTGGGKAGSGTVPKRAGVRTKPHVHRHVSTRGITVKGATEKNSSNRAVKNRARAEGRDADDGESRSNEKLSAAHVSSSDCLVDPARDSSTDSSTTGSDDKTSEPGSSWKNPDDEYMEDLESECKPVKSFWWYNEDDEYMQDLESECKPVKHTPNNPDDEFFNSCFEGCDT
ncbi:unnamed protein product [Pylaiella littoralis]